MASINPTVCKAICFTEDLYLLVISKLCRLSSKEKAEIKLEKDLKLGEEMNELMLAKYSENENHLCVLTMLPSLY